MGVEPTNAGFADLRLDHLATSPSMTRIGSPALGLKKIVQVIDSARIHFLHMQSDASSNREAQNFFLSAEFMISSHD